MTRSSGCAAVLLAGLAVVALVCAPLTLVPAAAHRAPLASPAFEVALPLNPAELTADQVEGRVADAAAAGVTTVQSAAVWWWMCPRPQECRWEDLDRLVAALRRHRLALSLQVVGVPDWAHPDVGGSPDERRWTMPRTDAERAAFAGFAASVAGRYADVVRRVELWNEPNHPDFAGGGPDPGAFAELLVACADPVRRAAPRARVTAGGVSRVDLGFVGDYLAALDRLAPGRRVVDEVGVHPYSDADAPLVDDPAKRPDHLWQRRVDDNFPAVARLATLLGRSGSTAGIWIGEYGFSTTRTWMAPVPDARRALYLAWAVDLARVLPRVSGLCWYGYVPSSATGPEWSTATADGRRSATFDALRLVSRGVGALAVPAAPPGGTVTASASRLGVTGAVGRTEVFAGGRLVRTVPGEAAALEAGQVAAFYDGDALRGYTAAVGTVPDPAR